MRVSLGCPLTLYAIVLGVTLAATPRLDAAESSPLPNILWLIGEDLGVELGCYGAAEVSTPNLDRLAAAGVRYTKAYVTCPVCSPSRSAFCTGMYQTTIGAQNHRSHRDDGYQLPAGVRPITDWMRDAGYFTANLVRLPSEFGFKGEGKVDWNFAHAAKPFDSSEWEDLKSHQPFYAQLNFYETHRAYRAPAHADPNKVVLPPYYPDDPVVRRDWAAYLDSATELDRKIGLVLARLAAEGLAENTVVVFFGDNGQSQARGKQWCYETGMHVPLIIYWPKNASLPPPAHFTPGSVDERLIASIDFLPTMLALAGVARPEKMEGQPFLGPQADPPRQYVFGGRDRCDETYIRQRTVRDIRCRYIRNFTPEKPFLTPNDYKDRSYPVIEVFKRLSAEGKLTPPQAALCAPSMSAEELYDLENDPYEIHNLVNSPEQQTTLGRLRDALTGWIDQTHDQGQTPEPADVIDRQGLTKPGGKPSQRAAIIDESPVAK
jgi:arylsulfatase A-like enzyme